MSRGQPLMLAVLLGLAAPAGAWETRLGGDARLYSFLRVGEGEEARRDAELGVLRLRAEARRGEEWLAEAHGVLTLASPRSADAVSVATGETRRLLRLGTTLTDGEDASLAAELDRLSVAWRRPGFRAVAGRQAITWGVGYFWPALDLFAPFAPERVDREYKPGVDALRLTVPLGPLSELDLVLAGQGTSLARDASAGGLARVHLGPADVGAMAGWFHRDRVAGAFVAASLGGTGLRGEAAFTESGDPADGRLGRRRFWRASLGLDRQLAAAVAAGVELAWNGFGASGPAGYADTAAADRVRRGEVTGLGRLHAGASLVWQAHPLVTATGAALASLGDGSVLLSPRVDWSVADDLVLTLGGTLGLGAGLAADGGFRSEYGGAPHTLYAAFRAYF